MTTPQGARERRHHIRICPKGTVILRTADYARRARIANISHGGICVTTRATVPEHLLDSDTELDLRLDGRTAEWLRVSGRIIRLTGRGLAIQFAALPPVLTRTLDDMAGESRAARRRITVVLIDPDPAQRGTVANAFRDVGCIVVEGSTPLEAIVRLGEASFEPDLIAVADTIPSSTGEDLRRFVEREHPHAKLVMIGPGIDGPAAIVHYLSAADPDSDLVERVRAVVVRPRS